MPSRPPPSGSLSRTYCPLAPVSEPMSSPPATTWQGRPGNAEQRAKYEAEYATHSQQREQAIKQLEIPLKALVQYLQGPAQKRLAELRETDPAAYAVELHEQNQAIAHAQAIHAQQEQLRQAQIRETIPREKAAFIEKARAFNPKLDADTFDAYYGEVSKYATSTGLITPEEAKLSQNKNLVTRALGIDPTVDPEIHVYETQPEDIYLLCSDGLSDMVEDEEIRLTLITLKTNPSLTVQQLVQAANDNGGRDNISAMLIRVAEPFGVARGWLARLKALFR